MKLHFALITTIFAVVARISLHHFNLPLFQIDSVAFITNHFLRHHHQHKNGSSKYMKLRGLNYTPRKGSSFLHDIEKECKNESEIQSDFGILSQITDYFHLYSLAECSQARIILPIAKKMKVKIFLNIWVDGSPINSTTSSFAEEMRELDYLLVNQMIDTTVVKAMSVGSESYHRHETTIQENISYLTIAKNNLHVHNFTDIPLTVTDIDKTFMAFPDLMEAVDFASINAFPFFDTAYGKRSPEGAVFYLKSKILQPLLDESNHMGKSLFLTETGWPQEGTDCSNSGVPCSEASVANQIRYFVDFYCGIHVGEPLLQYFWFDGLDSSWRREQDVSKDSVEGHFGIFNDDGVMKDHFRYLSFQCPSLPQVTFKFPNISYISRI